MSKVNKVLQSIDSRFPQSPEAKKKRRDFIYKPLASVALLGVAFGGAAAAGTGLRLIDEATQRTIDSVTETMGHDEDYITLAKRAVIGLGLSPDDYSETDIGNGVEGDATPQPGQQVTFDEVQHWYGATSVEGHTEDTDN
jgi:hypothetical protein